jgi:hypothetical protein
MSWCNVRRIREVPSPILGPEFRYIDRDCSWFSLDTPDRYFEAVKVAVADALVSLRESRLSP